MKTLSQLAYHINYDGKEYDGGSGGDIEVIGDQQSAQATEIADADGQPDNLVEAACEEVCCHLRDGEQ